VILSNQDTKRFIAKVDLTKLTTTDKKSISKIASIAFSKGISVEDYLKDIGCDPWKAVLLDRTVKQLVELEYIEITTIKRIKFMVFLNNFLSKLKNNFLSKFVDVICFVIGPTIFVCSAFSFRYFYRGDYPFAIIGIGIGVALICMGILRKHWRKKVSNEK